MLYRDEISMPFVVVAVVVVVVVVVVVIVGWLVGFVFFDVSKFVSLVIDHKGKRTTHFFKVVALLNYGDCGKLSTKNPLKSCLTHHDGKHMKRNLII